MLWEWRVFYQNKSEKRSKRVRKCQEKDAEKKTKTLTPTSPPPPLQKRGGGKEEIVPEIAYIHRLLTMLREKKDKFGQGEYRYDSWTLFRDNKGVPPLSSKTTQISSLQQETEDSSDCDNNAIIFFLPPPPPLLHGHTYHR